VNKTRSAIGALRLREQKIQPAQRNRTAIRIPADRRGRREAIDLPGLHKNPPRCQTIGAAVGMESIDKPSGRPIPAFARPQRQRALDHELLQNPDDIVGTLKICRGGGVNHRISLPKRPGMSSRVFGDDLKEKLGSFCQKR